MQRRRSKPHSFADHLEAEKQRLQKQVGQLPHGVEKDALLTKIKQLDTALHMDEWLSSPGLRSPK